MFVDNNFGELSFAPMIAARKKELAAAKADPTKVIAPEVAAHLKRVLIAENKKAAKIEKHVPEAKKINKVIADLRFAGEKLRYAARKLKDPDMKALAGSLANTAEKVAGKVKEAGR